MSSDYSEEKVLELLDIANEFHNDFAIIAKRHMTRVKDEEEREYLRSLMQDKTSLFAPWVYDVTIGDEPEPEGTYVKKE